MTLDRKILNWKLLKLNFHKYELQVIIKATNKYNPQ